VTLKSTPEILLRQVQQVRSWGAAEPSLGAAVDRLPIEKYRMAIEMTEPIDGER
jgi:hypothetical protein